MHAGGRKASRTFILEKNMRPSALLSAVVIAACASGNSDPAGSAVPVTTVSRPVGTDAGNLGGGILRVAASDGPSTTTVAFPVDSVFKALPAIYASLGVRLTVLDPKQHTLGNEAMKVRRQLGTVALRTYIDCGSSQGMPSADTYDVVLSVVTHVRATEPTGSEIATTVNASAKPMLFAQEWAKCGTTGALENRISEMVKASFIK
jgi:hypothetical protein